MIWGAISNRGKFELAVVDGTKDADAYIEMLKEHVLSFIEKSYC